MAENEVQKVAIGSFKIIESIWLQNHIFFIMACNRPVEFYWLYECKAIYLLRCMEWPKTFNEVSGHYKNNIVM